MRCGLYLCACLTKRKVMKYMIFYFFGLIIIMLSFIWDSVSQGSQYKFVASYFPFRFAEEHLLYHQAPWSTDAQLTPPWLSLSWSYVEKRIPLVNSKPSPTTKHCQFDLKLWKTSTLMLVNIFRIILLRKPVDHILIHSLITGQ